MEIELHEINVTLSKYQKERLYKAFHDRESIFLRLKNDALSGSDTLLVPSKSLKRMKDDNLLDKSTFFERLQNGTLFANSTNNENLEILEKYYILYHPNVVEMLLKCC